MPNWKYPCIECKGPVKTNQKGIECNTCKLWVHLKCTNLTEAQYDFLENNENLPFYCCICQIRPSYTDLIFENTEISANLITSLLNDSSSDLSSAHSSDFEYITDSDAENDTRGLNFYALPVQNTVPACTKKKIHHTNYACPCYELQISMFNMS